MIRKFLGLAAVVTVALSTVAAHAQNVEGQVIVSQFANWRLDGKQALVSGSNPLVPFEQCSSAAGGKNFALLANSTPVRIVDPSDPAIDETVTPSNVVVSAYGCTATLAPANNHPLPYYLISGTGGLQEAINANALSAVQNTAILDKRFYGEAGGTAAIIAAVAGSDNLALVDVTQAPYVTYRSVSGVYTANGNTGGAAPTSAAGAAAGTSPTITNVGNGNTFTVSLTTGTATTTGTLFTETWPSSGSFGYAPNVTVKATGTNPAPAFTYAVSGSSTHVLTVTVSSAPTASTGYIFQVSAQ